VAFSTVVLFTPFHLSRQLVAKKPPLVSSSFGGQPTRLQILWGESPLPSIARFGRLVYPGHGEVTNRGVFGGKSHRCCAFLDVMVGAVRVASKGRGLNIRECLQPRNECRTEAAIVRVLWKPTLSERGEGRRLV
jgi:hypothetical protein